MGLDVKTLRTQREGVDAKHLENSRSLFLDLVEVAKGIDRRRMNDLHAHDYEELERYVIACLIGRVDPPANADQHHFY